MTIPIGTARTAAESLMTSACTIRERGDGFVTDPVTFEVTPAVGAVVYSGKCRVKPGGGTDPGGGIEAGGGEAFTYDLQVSVPFSADVPAGSILTVDSSPDASLVGVRAEVARVARGEHISARRLLCREAT